MSESIKHSVCIYTLGCKVNQYESQAIAEEFVRRGFEVLNAGEVCDVYVINTCTVTSESDRKARQFIRRAINENPCAYILVTGCLAQTKPETIEAIAGVDYICGNANKIAVVDAAVSLIESGAEKSAVKINVTDIDGADFEHMEITEFDRTRAYVKIEDGCENKCTYCIIPYARGKVRSKPQNEVINEIETLVRSGCREVVLTGIETAAYGHDLEDTDLASLLCAVDGIEGIGRVRLGSLDPSLIKQSFVDKIKGLKSLTPHFHLSLQSGSNRVLANMKRKYNREMALEAIERLRCAIPGVQFTTDIIVGFPGETEEDFAQTLSFIRLAKFINIHVFTYSKREGTPAASMDGQIPEEIKHLRSAELTECERHIRAEVLHGFVGQTLPVLFESYENGYAYGHTASFAEVRVKSPKNLHSELRLVRILSADDEICEGVIVHAVRKHGIVSQFCTMDTKILELMKDDLGLVSPVSAMKKWQRMFARTPKKEPTLDEIYFTDRLDSLCVSSPECISISSFETDSQPIMSVFDDFMSKYTQMNQYNNIPCSLSDAALTANRYLTDYSGIVPPAEKNVNFRNRLSNGDKLVIIDGDENKVSDFIDNHIKIAVMKRKLRLGGVAGVLCDYTTGAAIDVSAITDNTENLPESLCDCCIGKYIVGVSPKKLDTFAEDARKAGLGVTVCGKVNKTGYITAYTHYGAMSKYVCAVSLPVAMLRKFFVKIPFDFNIQDKKDEVSNKPYISENGACVCNLGKNAFYEAAETAQLALRNFGKLGRIKYCTRNPNTALAAILGVYSVQTSTDTVSEFSEVVCDIPYGSDKIEISYN